MDRVEFLHAIDYGDKSINDMIINHLDQCMILYDLVNSSDKVKRIEDANNTVSFQIDLFDNKSTEVLLNKINATPNISRYGRNVVNINFSVISDNSIVIKMTKFQNI